MKRNAVAKSTKKQNIQLRRKIAILYRRSIITTKVIAFIVLYLIFFNRYFIDVKNKIADIVYDASINAGFVLKNVVIEGRINASQNDILEALDARKGVAIIAINIDNVKNNLESNSWIRAAAIERKLPNTIYIAISEKTPIAIWQNNKKLYLIDALGNIITDQNIEKFANLLHVVGIDANIYADQLIHDISQHPNIAAKIISASRYGERRWNLNIEENITVKMPEIGFVVAFEYIAKLDRAGKLFNQNYKVIDLRDANKYYIEKY